MWQSQVEYSIQVSRWKSRFSHKSMLLGFIYSTSLLHTSLLSQMIYKPHDFVFNHQHLQYYQLFLPGTLYRGSCLIDSRFSHLRVHVHCNLWFVWSIAKLVAGLRGSCSQSLLPCHFLRLGHHSTFLILIVCINSLSTSFTLNTSVAACIHPNMERLLQLL